MKKNVFLVVMPVLLLAWGMALTGCPIEPEDPAGFSVKSPG